MLVFSSDLLPGKQSIIDKLFPGGWQPIVVQLLAMLVLTIAFIFLLFKPVRKIIKARQDHIESNIKEAEEKNQAAEQYLQDAHQRVGAAKIQAQDILVEARKEALVARDEIMSKTSHEVKDLKVEADRDIADSRLKAQEEIRQSIVDVAFSASEQLLGREIEKSDNDRLVDDFLKTLEDKDS